MNELMARVCVCVCVCDRQRLTVQDVAAGVEACHDVIQTDVESTQHTRSLSPRRRLHLHRCERYTPYRYVINTHKNNQVTFIDNSVTHTHARRHIGINWRL